MPDIRYLFAPTRQICLWRDCVDDLITTANESLDNKKVTVSDLVDCISVYHGTLSLSLPLQFLVRNPIESNKNIYVPDLWDCPARFFPLIFFVAFSLKRPSSRTRSCLNFSLMSNLFINSKIILFY